MDNLRNLLLGGNQSNPGNKMEFIRPKASDIRSYHAFGESVESPNVTPEPLPSLGVDEKKKRGLVGDVVHDASKVAETSDPEVGGAEDVGKVLFGIGKRKQERKQERIQQEDNTMQMNDTMNQQSIDNEQNQSSSDSRSGGA